MRFALALVVFGWVSLAAGVCLACGVAWGPLGVAGALVVSGVLALLAALLVDFERGKST